MTKKIKRIPAQIAYDSICTAQQRLEELRAKTPISNEERRQDLASFIDESAKLAAKIKHTFGID